MNGTYKRKKGMKNPQEAKNQKKNDKKVNKKRKWFRTQRYKNSINENSSASQKDCELETKKHVMKTVATYSKSNPSSNWKNLLQVLNFESEKKDTAKTISKGKSFIKREKKLKNSVTKKSSSSDHEIKTPNKKLDIWFDDVDEELLALNEISEPLDMQPSKSKETNTDSVLAKPGTFCGCTKTVAMDCEMVGVGEGGKENELARVSIVNRMGHCIYDTFVKPREEVVDYRTHVSGVRPSDLINAEEFATVQKEVYNIIKGRILVGHAIHNDLQVLYLSHPKSKIRDTARYKPFRQLFNGRIPSLKKLSEKLLGVEVQTGEHNSVQDAQAAMRLYTMHGRVWEKELKSKRERKTVAQKSVRKKPIENNT